MAKKPETTIESIQPVAVARPWKSKSNEELLQAKKEIEAEMLLRIDEVQNQLAAMKSQLGITEEPIRKGRGEGHTSITVDDLKAKILSKVSKEPKSKAEILKELGITPAQKTWGDAIDALKTEKKLKTEGKGRGMTIISL